MFPDQFCSKLFKVWRVVMFLFSIITTYHQVPTTSLDSLDQWSPSKALLIPIPFGFHATGCLWCRHHSTLASRDGFVEKALRSSQIWGSQRENDPLTTSLRKKQVSVSQGIWCLYQPSFWMEVMIFSIQLKVLIGFQDVAKVIVLPQDDMCFPSLSMMTMMRLLTLILLVLLWAWTKNTHKWGLKLEWGSWEMHSAVPTSEHYLRPKVCYTGNLLSSMGLCACWNLECAPFCIFKHFSR